MWFEETELLPKESSSLNFSATGWRVLVLHWIEGPSVNFAAFWYKVKNVEEPSLYPALPPPSNLLSIGSAQLVKQNTKTKNPTYVILWQWGSSSFRNEISHVMQAWEITLTKSKKQCKNSTTSDCNCVAECLGHKKCPIKVSNHTINCH